MIANHFANSGLSAISNLIEMKWSVLFIADEQLIIELRLPKWKKELREATSDEQNTKWGTACL